MDSDGTFQHTSDATGVTHGTFQRVPQRNKNNMLNPSAGHKKFCKTIRVPTYAYPVKKGTFGRECWHTDVID